MSVPESETTGGGSPGPLLRIGELSRRTGVSADTLRAWERRYRLLEPARTPGGFRLYDEDDVTRVRAMRALIDSGISASEAAREARGARRLEARDEPPAAGTGARLEEALEAFDEVGANAILDQAVAALSVEALCDSVVLPAMQAIGERWSRGEVSVAQEHFASNLLRGRLLGVARGWGGGSGPGALLACPPGELHDIGLIAFGLALRSTGRRITYLGADTPIGTVADAATRIHPELVVVAALSRERLEAVAEELGALSGDHRLLIGGEGASRELADRVGATLLPMGPVRAAAAVAESPPSA